MFANADQEKRKACPLLLQPWYLVPQCLAPPDTYDIERGLRVYICTQVNIIQIMSTHVRSM